MTPSNTAIATASEPEVLTQPALQEADPTRWVFTTLRMPVPIAESNVIKAPTDDTYHQLLRFNHNGKLQHFQMNIELELENSDTFAGAFSWDEFHCQPKMLRPIPGVDGAGTLVKDQHLLAIKVWFEKNHNLSPSMSLLRDAVRAVARRNPCHAVRDYLEGLRWDGRERLDDLHHRYFGAAKNVYNERVFFRTMIGAVARAYEPGVKMDTCLVLEGPQGTFKSSSIRTLFVHPNWVNDTPLDLRSKDAQIGIKGRWAVEFAELDSLSRVDSSRVKAFLSIQQDTYRVPFGVNAEAFPRSCVFIGTSNEAAYLLDPTGGRRFWPVEVGKINMTALAADRDQLWAEAVYLYKLGASWHLTPYEEELAKEQQDRRRLEHPMEGPIRDYLEDRADTTINEILHEALDMKLFRANGKEGRQITQILTGVLGWRRGKVYRQGRRLSGFLRRSEAPAIDCTEPDEVDDSE